MTPSPINGPASTCAKVPQNPARVVVIVPRRETRLHGYLCRSLAAVKDVEVVLDRRTTVVTPSDDRRRRPSKETERKILICSLVRCPADPPSPNAAPSQDDAEHRRTLLWPGLRLEHL
jgi:hypothetical protein